MHNFLSQIQSTHTFLLQKWFEHTCFVAKTIYTHFFVAKTIYTLFFVTKKNLRTFFLSRKRFTRFFVAKTIYALRPESFCALKVAIRKVQTFWASATCIAWSGRKLFGITFVIYIHALALVEHHPSFRPEFLPRPTVSYCVLYFQSVSYWVSHFPDRLYRICNWQMGVGRFLGFLQVLMAVQWLLGTIWWSRLAQRETQKP